MDATTALTTITAPTSTDNQTVILWVVGVLLVVIALVGKILWDKLQDNEKRMRSEIEKANARSEAATATIVSLQSGVIMDQQKTQMQSNSAMEKVATAVTEMATAVTDMSRVVSDFENRRTPRPPSGEHSRGTHAR